MKDLVRGVKLLAASALLGMLIVMSFNWDTAMDAEVRPEPETFVNQAADQLIVKYDCWRGDDGPKGVIPSHAVFMLPGQPVRYGSGDVGFDIWLHGKPGVLFAFCR